VRKERHSDEGAGRRSPNRSKVEDTRRAKVFEVTASPGRKATVLPHIGEIGRNERDLARTERPGRIGRENETQEPVIRRRQGADEIDGTVRNIGENPNVGLAVGKAARLDRTQVPSPDSARCRAKISFPGKGRIRRMGSCSSFLPVEPQKLRVDGDDDGAADMKTAATAGVIRKPVPKVMPAAIRDGNCVVSGRQIRFCTILR